MRFLHERDFSSNGNRTFYNTFDSDPLPPDSCAGSSRDSVGAALIIDTSTLLARSR